MTLNITPIPAFNDNYIWVIHDHRHAVVVDPGTAAPVNDYLDRHDLKLSQILITHHHWDHVNGLTDLQKRHSCMVYAPEDSRIPGQLNVVKESDKIHLPELDVSLKITETPGHTSSHICYFNDDWLFCGDTLFSIGCGRMFEGTPKQFSDSLLKLSQLPDHTRIYCTHEYTASNVAFALSIEPDNQALLDYQDRVQQTRMNLKPTLPSNMAQEKALNPFLKINSQSFQQHMAKITESNISDEVTCFAILRQMKDEF